MYLIWQNIVNRMHAIPHNDDLGPISKADSIEMKKPYKNDVKPATETSSATDENSNKKESTKNGGGLIVK